MNVTLQREHAGLQTPSPKVTQQTVRKMCELIRAGAGDPLIVSTAQSVAPMGPDQRMAPSDALARLWYWVKLHVKFIPDEVQTLKMFGEKDNFELLISPPVLIRMNQPAGDCDCFTMLLLALARAIGFDTRIVTLMCDRRRPGEYTHVYGSAYAPDLQAWIPLDASHGDYPGWEVPERDVTRRTEWNMSGQIVVDTNGSPRRVERGRPRSPVSPMSTRQASLAGSNGLGSAGQFPSMPVIITPLPFIGTIDLTNPMEWLFFGGALASLALAKSGTAKLAGAAGFLGARAILEQTGASV